MMSPPRYLCVFCGSSSGSRPVHAEMAKRVGKAIAREGLGLVYGGGSVGLMGIVADAALAAGASVIGVIPQHLARKEIVHDRLTEIHIVGDMHQRKAMMADRSFAFLTLAGGIGTLEEFFEILSWAALGLHSKPMGVLDTDGIYQPLRALLAHTVVEGFSRAQYIDAITYGSDPEDLVVKLARQSPHILEARWTQPAP